MPGSCALTQDYTYGCDVGAGGTKECYLIELENLVSLTESSGTITTITKVTGKQFRKYALVLDTSSFDETITGNRPNGTLFYAQKGTIIINKQNVNMRNEIMLLAKNNLVIIIKDQNQTYRLYGRLNGLRLQSGSAATGVTLADRNGYNLELTGNEPELAPFVDSAIISTLQTPGT